MNHQYPNSSGSFQFILFLLLTVFVTKTFISCDNDPILELEDPMEDPVKEIVISHSSDLYVGSISGKVVGEDLEALNGVNINIRGNEIITDENGYFNLRDIDLDAHGTVVVASLDNYWTITKMVTPSKGQQNEIRIMLRPKTELSTIEASIGGMVNFNNGIKIDFQKNSFVTSTGKDYDGEVVIAAIHLDPDDDNFGMMSPGDFRAFDADSELQSLVSLGMAGVELTGTDNQVLEIKNDMESTLFIKVPEGTSVDEVPLWHFDEDSGYWLEEGLATREGDFYVGEVSHFSWWNCDIPFSAVKLSGSVLNTFGTGISGLQVSIILEENMRNLGDEFTGTRGLFCGWIPKGQNLIIQIKNECGIVIYEENIGAFEENVNLPPVIIEDQNAVEICGTLSDCNDELLTNGYLVVSHGGYKTFIPVDASGNFCSRVNICDATTFDLYGIDLDAGLQGLGATFDISDSPLNDLALSACDEIAAIFSYQINNEPEIFLTDFSMSLDADGVFIAGGIEVINGMYPGLILDGQNWGTIDFSFGYFNVAIAAPNAIVECDFFLCNAPNVEIIDFGGVGNPIALKIVGTSDQGNSYKINISGILE